jgi:hypothetical protein
MLHRTKPRGGARREDKRLRTVCQSGESQQRWLNQESPAFRRGECQAIAQLRLDGDSTTKQIWLYLPPEGRAEMTLEAVQESMEEMEKDGLVKVMVWQ